MFEFKYTKQQREQLVAAAKFKFSPDYIDVFLNESQRLVAQWLNDFPSEFSDNKKSREAIKNFIKKLESAKNAMRTLPSMSKDNLANNWRIGYAGKKYPSSLSELEVLFLDMERCASDLITNHGTSRSIESKLICDLACSYVDTFKKCPTTSPGGSFMNFIKELSENIISPDYKKVVFGKDLIATEIKYIKNRCKEMDEFNRS